MLLFHRSRCKHPSHLDFILQAKAATGYYKEAEELLVQITDPDIRQQQSFAMVLCRCYIYGGHAELVKPNQIPSILTTATNRTINLFQAWNFYMSKETNGDSLTILQLIASECFRVGEYWIAAKAFDMLEKYSLEPNPEFWEGKRGACVGALYSVISERSVGTSPGGLIEICALLRESINPQAESIVRVIRRFAAEY